MQNKKKRTKKQSKIRDLKPTKDAKGGLKYGTQGPRPYSSDAKHLS